MSRLYAAAIRLLLTLENSALSIFNTGRVDQNRAGGWSEAEGAG
jgi:hypothetical protein